MSRWSIGKLYNKYSRYFQTQDISGKTKNTMGKILIKFGAQCSICNTQRVSCKYVCVGVFDVDTSVFRYLINDQWCR